MSKTSKSKIDRSGTLLSLVQNGRDYDESALDADYIFDEYRRNHLEPLTNLTLKLQEWLQSYSREYFVAQRLKRKPQILRKLKRLSVRLTQLQDIGGCRIIVEKNSDVDDVVKFISDKIAISKQFRVIRSTDYRELGRDDTGYRAFHLIMQVNDCFLELQIRSRLQHYWAESIERTSVIYGMRLKEREGDPVVIDYFKDFSKALYSIEVHQKWDNEFELMLQKKRELAEAVIINASSSFAMSSHVNEGIIRTLSEAEASQKGSLNNWILVFDWNDGNFVTWDVVGRNSDDACNKYLEYERNYPEEEKFEVVMIGSSNISTVKQTHSHYFGIEHHNTALEEMETSIIGLSNRMNMDIGARRILAAMKRRGYWNKNTIKVDTLKNHFCQNIATFSESLQTLRDAGYILGSDPISLDVRKSGEVHKFS
jgi:ppGpp synthetase/RelA/SpoT-type nucleotidyltranferase